MAFTHAIFGGGDTPTPPSTIYGEVQVLLWENDKPTTAFAPQTINLNLSDYEGVIIEFNKNTTDTTIGTRIKVDKNSLSGGFSSANLDGSYSRNVTINDSGVIFTNALQNGTVSNTNVVPINIYGYRKYNDTDITGIISNVLLIGGGTIGTVPSGFKKSYFIPYRQSGKYSAEINGAVVMTDNDNTVFQVYEVQPNDTFNTKGSTGTRSSILIQLN